MPAPDKTKKLRRRWWQVLLRWGIVGTVLAAGAYVTLPWWAPTRLLARRIADDMARQTGVDVRISKITLSWSEGVVLEELAFDSPRGFGPGSMPMVRVRRIRADLSPIDLIFHKRIDWMEVHGVEVAARFDRRGDLNLRVLKNLVFDAKARRISVHEASATVRLPDHDRLLRLNVRDLQLLAGRVAVIGRVTMSADLEQGGTSAPVSLHLAEGGRQDPVAGVATFAFAEIDLAQLPLVTVLPLPLAKLAGRCAGSLELNVDRHGRVDRFALDVSVQNLDVQTKAGPDLPVIRRAGLHVDAAYDMITGRLDVSAISLRLPGIDLAGTGTFFLDLSQGRLPVTRSVDLAGTLHPSRLASVLTGREHLAGGLLVRGPVGVKLLASERRDAIVVDLSLDAAKTVVRHGADTLKPAGRALRVRVRGRVDLRQGSFAARGAEGVELVLGDNRFRGAGTVRNFQRLTERWARSPSRKLAEAIADLRDLSWRGRWEIADPNALRDLWPGGPAILRQVRLRGPARGKCSIEPGVETLVLLTATVPDATGLGVAGLFAKPEDANAQLVLSGALVGGEAPGIRDLNVSLVVGGPNGKGRAHLSNGSLRLTGDANDPDMRLGARFDLDRVPAFLRWLPPGRRPKGLTGGAEGKFTALLTPARQQLRAELDLGRLGVTVRNLFAKPAGKQMTAVATFDRTATSERGALELQFPGEAAIQAWLQIDPPAERRPAPSGRAGWTVDLTDAAWVARTLPVARQAMGRGRVRGPAKLQGWIRWASREVNVEFVADGDELTYDSGDPTGRTKAAGVPLGVAAAVHLGLGEKPDGAPTASLTADIELAGSRLAMDLTTPLPLDANALRARFGADALPKGLSAELEASCTLDAALLNLLPELRSLAQEHGLSGAVAGKISLDSRREEAALECELDAAALAVRRVGAFTKPAGLAASLAAKLDLAHDLSSGRLRELYARLADVHCVAAGEGAIVRAEGRPPVLKLRSGRAALSTRKAQTLRKILPLLKPYELAGDAFVDVQWSDGVGGPAIPRAEIRIDDLRGQFRGKKIGLAGHVQIEGVSGLRDPIPAVRRIVTDGLSFRIGDNRGTILADLTGLPATPAGSANLLAEYLDAKDLAEWIAPSPGPPPAEPLAEAQIAELRTTADEAIAELRKRLAGANLAVRADISRLRTFDAKVGQFYLSRHLGLDATVNRGLVRLKFACGVSGGTLSSSTKVDFNAPAPEVDGTTTFRDVLASKTIVPQLQRFFPGNTLYGHFTREEKLTTPLRDMLAGAMDPRAAARSVGSAKIVAADGLVVGRAAPHFVVALFPGLNLAEYRYNKMTGFTTFTPEGVAINDLIFNGPVYDMYMEGSTGADHVARYEVGIILLSTPQSPELNHDLRLGRIPILKVSGRVEKGKQKLADEAVSYPWPTETLFTLFLKNNPVYRLWLTATKPK